MSNLKLTLAAIGAAAVLAAGALELASAVAAAPAAETAIPATAAEHAAEAEKYEQEALALEQKAKRHEEMARGYRARYSGGGRQATMLLSLVAHCERLAKVYAEAAVEARATAKSHRDMAQSM